jgi:hypothetical protein
MNPGEAFEIRCYEYLKKAYENRNAIFERKGGMDSTTSDIAVIKNQEVDFYIEAKDATAQSGQFVLIPDVESQTFKFSPLNHSEPNEMTDIIINYMNQNFDKFNHAGTSGEQIDIDTNVFSGWIVNHYKDKNVKYFISYEKGYVILPIRKFAAYFDIKATYRIKKSGSNDPAKKDFDYIKTVISKKYPSAIFSEDKKKLFAVITENIVQDRIEIENNTYYLSPQEKENTYRIKKLSNTYHMNVIFSIRLKKHQDSVDLDEFESDL